MNCAHHRIPVRRLSTLGLLAAAAWFAATAGLGLAFLAVKGIEYRREYLEGLMPMGGPPSPLAGRPAALFMDLYFVATALHAVHLGIGVAAVGTLAMRLARRRLRAPGQAIVAEMTGLYWHFVDVVWIFLFPVLYLARP